MATVNLTSRPKIVGSQTGKFVGQQVTVVGEVLSITPHANTLCMRLADEENIIVLLQKNSTTIEQNLLTQVSGKLVSRGQIECTHIKQFDSKATLVFNKSLFVEAAQVYDAHRRFYDI